LKLGHGLFFFAVVLLAGAPAFADKIDPSFADSDRDAFSLQGSSARTFSPEDSFAFCRLSITDLREGEFRIATNHAHLVSDPDNDDKSSDLFSRLNFRRGPRDRDADWSELGSKHVDSFDRDNDGRLYQVVATPEPASATLLLFGFAVLGVIIWRRSTL
jgi:PEP-CTERM motif